MTKIQTIVLPALGSVLLTAGGAWAGAPGAGDLTPTHKSYVKDVEAYTVRIGKALEEFGKTPAKFAETVGSHDPEGCSMAVKKALTQAKVPATAPVKAGGKEIPLSEVTEKVCDAAQKVLDAAKNAAFDGLSPERAEEAKVWKGYTFYGKGKKELTTNAEKQKSPVWVFWDEVKGFSMPHWKLYHLKWSGKAFKRTELTGQGMEPPAKLFK